MCTTSIYSTVGWYTCKQCINLYGGEVNMHTVHKSIHWGANDTYIVFNKRINRNE